MTTTVTSYLGLVLAVPATKEPFSTGTFNQNLTKLENKIQNVEGQAQGAQATAVNGVNNANGAQQTANAAYNNAAGAQNTANDAWTRANNAQGSANNAQNTANDAWNRANNAQGRADDAFNRTSDLYNRTGGVIAHIAGAITPGGTNNNYTQHVNWSFGSKPVAVVTPETASAGACRMTLTNITTGGCDVVINRSDNTSTTGFNIIAIG